jgi:hypothetical protein
MTDEQMRERVATAYSGDSWRKKVYAMPQDQIVAIYYKLLKSGRIK